MKKLFFYLLFALLFVNMSYPTYAEENCEDCHALRHGVDRVIIPTNDVVCIYYMRPPEATGRVILRLDLKNGKARRYPAKHPGASGRICVGRHWVRDSWTMVVCDDQNHTNYNRADTVRVSLKPKTSPEAFACLYGEVECPKIREDGYKSVN